MDDPWLIIYGLAEIIHRLVMDRPDGFKATGLYGYIATWLHGCTAMWQWHPWLCGSVDTLAYIAILSMSWSFLQLTSGDEIEEDL